MGEEEEGRVLVVVGVMKEVVDEQVGTAAGVAEVYEERPWDRAARSCRTSLIAAHVRRGQSRASVQSRKSGMVVASTNRNAAVVLA